MKLIKNTHFSALLILFLLFLIARTLYFSFGLIAFFIIFTGNTYIFFHSSSLLNLNIQSVFNLPQIFLYICNLCVTKRTVATADIVIDFNTFLMD